MEKKDYLVEELSKEEKLYLKILIVNARKKYIRDNYNDLNSNNIDLYNCINLTGESVLDVVINRCENDIRSAFEFEKIISNEKLYNIVKALSLKEKMVLFLLYKENKTVNQIALEMKIERTTVWRIKARAIDKIMRKLLGGSENV